MRPRQERHARCITHLEPACAKVDHPARHTRQLEQLSPNCHPATICMHFWMRNHIYLYALIYTHVKTSSPYREPLGVMAGGSVVYRIVSLPRCLRAVATRCRR